MSDTNGTPRSARRIGALSRLWPFVKPHRKLAIGWLVVHFGLIPLPHIPGT